MKYHFKPAPVAAHREPAEEAGPHQQPHGYSLPGHPIKIFGSDAYKQAAKDAGHTPESFQNHVAEALKHLIAENNAAVLARFEEAFSAKAVSAATEKSKMLLSWLRRFWRRLFRHDQNQSEQPRRIWFG